MKQVNGFTLIELMTTLALVTILMAIAIPSLSHWLTQNKVNSLQYTLLHSLNFARVQGINRQTTTTLCPGIDQCDSDWGTQIIIFSDKNSDGVLDDTDVLLKKIPLPRTGGNLNWRSFRRKAYLQFNDEGLTRALNGTFHYCYPDSEGEYNFAITLAKTGRVRVHHEPNC